MDQNTAIIGEIKNGNIIISISEFNGKKFLDIRKFFRDDNEQLQPTKKGIAMNKEQFEGVLGILNDNKEEIKKLLD